MFDLTFEGLGEDVEREGLGGGLSLPKWGIFEGKAEFSASDFIGSLGLLFNDSAGLG